MSRQAISPLNHRIRLKEALRRSKAVIDTKGTLIDEKNAGETRGGTRAKERLRHKGRVREDVLGRVGIGTQSTEGRAHDTQTLTAFKYAHKDVEASKQKHVWKFVGNQPKGGENAIRASRRRKAAKGLEKQVSRFCHVRRFLP